ncbi:MAG TPA: alpha/beta hydrolase [Armatimonadota bacterium]|nr:alpha/beta hydrolase [Armatimonadota bacterium]
MISNLLYERPGGRDLTSAQLHCLRSGETGPRVILIHPIGFDCHTWDLVAPSLQARYQIAALDIPGHGESDWLPEADYRLPSLARRVLQFLDELLWRDAVFVGNSIGGGIALAAALLAPSRVRGLALLNASAFRESLPLLGLLGRLPFIEHVVGLPRERTIALGLRYARAGNAPASGERVRRCTDYLRNPCGRAAFLRTLRQLYGPSLDRLSDRYAAIRCPTLVAHGVEDPLIPLVSAYKLAAAIPGASIHEIPHCGHFPQEETAETVVGILAPFLEQFQE